MILIYKSSNESHIIFKSLSTVSLGKYVLKIHVKDFKRNGGCHTGGAFGKLLEGDVDWDTVAPLLAKYYDGPITAEVSRQADQTEDEFFASVNEAVKTIIAKAK